MYKEFYVLYSLKENNFLIALCVPITIKKINIAVGSHFFFSYIVSNFRFRNIEDLSNDEIIISFQSGNKIW